MWPGPLGGVAWSSFLSAAAPARAPGLPLVAGGPCGRVYPPSVEPLTASPCCPQVRHLAQRPEGVHGIRVPVRAYPDLDLGHERLGLGPVAEELAPAVPSTLQRTSQRAPCPKSFDLNSSGTFAFPGSSAYIANDRFTDDAGSTYLPCPSSIVSWADFNHLSCIHAFAYQPLCVRQHPVPNSENQHQPTAARADAKEQV